MPPEQEEKLENDKKKTKSTKKERKANCGAAGAKVGASRKIGGEQKQQPAIAASAPNICSDKPRPS